MKVRYWHASARNRLAIEDASTQDIIDGAGTDPIDLRPDSVLHWEGHVWIVDAVEREDRDVALNGKVYTHTYDITCRRSSTLPSPPPAEQDVIRRNP